MSNIETVSINVFNERLKSKSVPFKIPYEVTLELTYACNLRCVHCYNPTHHALPRELSLSEFSSVIDQLADIGTQMIIISGGEPLMRPDLFDLLGRIQSKGLQIVLNTNATLLTDDKLKRLQHFAPILLSVSVYGLSQPVYESVTQIPGSFARFSEALSLLDHSPLPVLFKMPVLTLNKHELATAKKFFQSRGQKLMHTVEIQPRVDHDLSPLRYRLPEEEAAKLRVEFDEVTRCGGYNPSEIEGHSRDHYLFDCQCGKSSAAVNPEGELNLCVSTPYPRYSLRTGSLSEGWQMLVDFVGGVRPSASHECPACDLRPFCTQGSMDAFLATGDFNQCLPYFKTTAAAAAQLIKAANAK